MQARGAAVPAHIATAPTLDDGDLYYWHGYADLLTARPYPGARIPWPALDAYARAYAPGDRAMFAYVIRLTESKIEALAGHD